MDPEDPNITYELMKLIFDDDIGQFNSLLDEHTDNYKSYKGNTLLHFAARYHKHRFVKALIDRGAVANTKNDDQYNALIYMLKLTRINRNTIINDNYHQTAKCLIEAGIDCNALDRSRHNALTLICDTWYCDTNYHILKPIIELLLDYGTNRNTWLTAIQMAKCRSNYELAQCIEDYQPPPDAKGCYDPSI